MLHRAVSLPPLKALTVALLSTVGMGHGFRYMGECFRSTVENVTNSHQLWRLISS
jgi:hypothetical protein